jgi:hypothetical protein
LLRVSRFGTQKQPPTNQEPAKTTWHGNCEEEHVPEALNSPAAPAALNLPN